jgi:asparagine synthase (glutamine-hydrolysing)
VGAQVGIYNRMGHGFAETLGSRLRPGLAACNPDGGRDVCSAEVAASFRALLVSPFDDASQPLESNGLILMWDGRLDNRADLICQLGVANAPRLSDAQLTLLAYQKWNVESFNLILGDWAVSIWDANQKRLVLARDIGGARPLYYRIGSEELVWASDVATILNLRLERFNVEDEWVAGYFCFGPEADLTPYRSIRAVRPGHFLLVTDHEEKIVRYWSPNWVPLVYKRDSEYEDHFYSLLVEAVRSRLQVTTPVWSHLSGGLDSSTITCIAHDLVRAGKVPTPRIETVSHVYDGSPESDEREFISSIEAHIGATGRHFSDVDCPVQLPMVHGPYDVQPNIGLCFRSCKEAVVGAMVADGARCDLSGEGGDELTGNALSPSTVITELFHLRGLSNLPRALGDWSLAVNESEWALLFRAATSTLPNSLRRFFRNRSPMGALVDPGFARRMNFPDRLLGTRDIYDSSGTARKARVAGFLSVVNHLCSFPARTIGPIDTTYPYLDRRLVEFMFRVPADQLVRPGERRSLMRRALRGVLPEKIRLRRSKKNPTAALFRCINRHRDLLESTLENAEVYRRDYVSRQQIREAIPAVCHGIRPATDLMLVLALESWLTHGMKHGTLA